MGKTKDWGGARIKKGFSQGETKNRVEDNSEERIEDNSEKRIGEELEDELFQ